MCYVCKYICMCTYIVCIYICINLTYWLYREYFDEEIIWKFVIQMCQVHIESISVCISTSVRKFMHKSSHNYNYDYSYNCIQQSWSSSWLLSLSLHQSLRLGLPLTRIIPLP